MTKANNTNETVRTMSSNSSLVRRQRSTIIRAAYQVFARKGYEGGNVREIAAMAGMTAGNIYRYVGSKRDILHLLCLSAYKNTVRLNAAFMAALKPEESRLDALKRAIRNYLRSADEWTEGFLFYDRNQQNISGEDLQLVRKNWVALVEFFEEIIKQGTERREFHVKHPHLLAHNIASLSHDWAMRKWYLSERYTVAEFAEKQIEIIVDSSVVIFDRPAVEDSSRAQGDSRE